MITEPLEHKNELKLFVLCVFEIVSDEREIMMSIDFWKTKIQSK